MLLRKSKKQRTSICRRRTPIQRGHSFETLESRRLMALVSHWTGDGTAAEFVGGNNGTLFNGTTYAAGQVGQAFSFDGANDRISVADSDSLKLTHSMTIEAWIKINGIPNGPPMNHGEILFRGDDRGGLDPYSLATEPGGAIRFSISSASNTGASVQAPAPIGQFVHVAATLDDASGAMRLYENGVLMQETITSIRPFADLDPAFNPGVGIGNHGGYPGTPHNFPFNGLIDDLKLYNEALTGEQILANFNAQKGSLHAAFSVSDAGVTEGDSSVKFVGNLVNQGEDGLTTPYHAIYGPDGNVYVSSLSGSRVFRFDAATGAPLPAPGKSGAEFVSPAAGGLDVARSIAFGPDGNLYVVSQNSDAVLRFDGATGEFLGALIPSGSGGLSLPRGLLFHTDGYLYVTSVGADVNGSGVDAILRFDSITGVPAGISGQPGDAVFIRTASGGMDNPSQIVFHNGNFYVASTSPSTSNSVLKFAPNGAFLGSFVPAGSGGLAGPAYIEFHDGYLYVASWTNSKILRYNGTTGAFVDEVVSGGGLGTPLSILFEPSGAFLVTSRDTDELRRYGESETAVFTINLSTPMPTTTSVSFATADGSAISGSDYISTSGTVMFEPGQIRKVISIPIVNDANIEQTETFSLVLSDAVEAGIADSTGIATINDDELPPTKFFVVNDATQNRTYEYGAAGNSIENYGLNSGNSAPRGAATTAVGDKVWVVDANKKVYVYSDSGALLGSWTAGGLHAAAQVEGIATNGTDIWLVDAKQDRVYRYTGAASRLSGSQNAASNFALNSTNKDPKDIVTDGVHLWVVNDTSTDKVFKYTLSGSLVGSWTISSSGGSPTGITIDPSNVSDVWIVDSASDRVYQFIAAASRTSGSQSPATSFALAAGNTNPQGIADPPAVGDDTPASLMSRTASLKAEAAKNAERRSLRAYDLQSALDVLLGQEENWLSRRTRRATVS